MCIRDSLHIVEVFPFADHPEGAAESKWIAKPFAAGSAPAKRRIGVSRYYSAVAAGQGQGIPTLIIMIEAASVFCIHHRYRPAVTVEVIAWGFALFCGFKDQVAHRIVIIAVGAAGGYGLDAVTEAVIALSLIHIS